MVAGTLTVGQDSKMHRAAVMLLASDFMDLDDRTYTRALGRLNNGILSVWLVGPVLWLWYRWRAWVHQPPANPPQ